MTERDTIRSINVCGDRIRFFRCKQGLTQAELAHRAGYSDRLIRKAEGGGSLSLTTLADIADALSAANCIVTVDDLQSSPLNVARQFLESYDLHYNSMLEHNAQLFSSDFVFNSSGDPASPLFGIWHGIEGLQKWLNLISSMVARPNRGVLKVTYLADGENVTAHYTDVFAASEDDPKEMWVNLHLKIRSGLIYYLSNQYDTHLASKLELASKTE